MLNLTRLHLGIAHESQFQGLGIISLICTCFSAFFFFVFPIGSGTDPRGRPSEGRRVEESLCPLRLGDPPPEIWVSMSQRTERWPSRLVATAAEDRLSA